MWAFAREHDADMVSGDPSLHFILQYAAGHTIAIIVVGIVPRATASASLAVGGSVGQHGKVLVLPDFI